MKKSVTIFLLAILAGCGTRKVNQTKAVDKLKSESFTASSDFLHSQSADFEFAYNKGYTYIKEPTQYGIKETFTQKNEAVQKIKYIEVARYRDSIQYINITSYKTEKIKKTQNDGVSSWVWIVGLFFVFLFLIVLNWKAILKQ